MGRELGQSELGPKMTEVCTPWMPLVCLLGALKPPYTYLNHSSSPLILVCLIMDLFSCLLFEPVSSN